MTKYTADFETIVDPNDCRVWAYACMEIGNTENYRYGNNIDEFMEMCEKDKNSEYYFHNLKFDGEFITNWLYANGFEHIENKKERRDKTFTTLITSMGAWYSVEVYFSVKGKKCNKAIFKDSLKILNFSVDKIAKSFNLPISKLSIDYKAFRSKDHKLTKEESDYIRNDVEIMARALNIMMNEQGHTKMTIASDALNDFKEITPAFKFLFPVLDVDIDADIRKSYKGGFTYLNPLYREKETGAGIVFDVNSMYPAKMKYEWLPWSIPEPFEGEYIQDDIYPLYIQKISCCFDLKKGKIPSIQIKNSASFMPNEYLESSHGEMVELTLCNPDFELFLENYDVHDLIYLGGWKFRQKKGIFSDYIDKWTASKIQAKKDGNGAMYTISKLFLNSLYGKFGLNPNCQKKIPVIRPDGGLGYVYGEMEQRESIYVAVAAFITAYARRYIIESSEAIREYSLKKYDKDCYVYSDTDSIHCTLTPEDCEELSKVMEIDDYKLGAWKLESTYRRGKYLRQKCYIEEDEDGVIHSTIAGLPKRLAPIINFDNFKFGFTTETLTKEQKEKYGSKLTYKHVKGGVILQETDFTIK